MADFSNFDTELSKVLQAAERGMTKAVIKFQGDTQLLTHVDTGTLRRSWTHKVEKNGDNIIGAVGSNVEYAPFEDALHPNISQALEDNIGNYVDTISREIKKALGGDGNG